jgi:hypothetical protein
VVGRTLWTKLVLLVASSIFFSAKSVMFVTKIGRVRSELRGATMKGQRLEAFDYAIFMLYELVPRDCILIFSFQTSDMSHQYRHLQPWLSRLQPRYPMFAALSIASSARHVP